MSACFCASSKIYARQEESAMNKTNLNLSSWILESNGKDRLWQVQAWGVLQKSAIGEDSKELDQGEGQERPPVGNDLTAKTDAWRYIS